MYNEVESTMLNIRTLYFMYCYAVLNFNSVLLTQVNEFIIRQLIMSL